MIENLPLRKLSSEYFGNIKFQYCRNGRKFYSIFSAKQSKTLQTPDGKNIFYPSNYFAYVMLNDVPTIYIEKETENGKFFTPAKFIVNDLNKAWTHNDRNTNLPFLTVSINDSSIKSKNTHSVIRIGEMFHLNACGKFKIEKIPPDCQFVDIEDI